MNKVVALSLVSVFLLSILVGYLPVITTQAQTASLQTHIVQIKPPFEFAIVITGANLGTVSGLIATSLNQTLNASKITITITDVQTGATEFTFTGNFNSSSALVSNGYDNALYSIVGQAIIIPVVLNANTKTTVSVGQLVSTIQSELGITLVNSTYPYLVNVTSGKVYTNQSAVAVNANGITGYVSDPYVTFYQYANTQQINGIYVWTYIQDPADLQQYDLELSVSVAPVVVVGTVQTAAPTASAVLFAPISIVKIYNQMMNDQSIGWGRSLINVTVNNPLQQTGSWYLYQLNFTGPGPTTVYFYPAVQIYSADQLYNLKPEVGLFSFTGPGKGQDAFNYTIVVMSMMPSLYVEVYYNGGKVGYPYMQNNQPAAIQAQGESTNGQQIQVNGYDVYLVAFTFSSSHPQGQYIYQVQNGQGQPAYIQVTINGYPVNVPIYAVYVNASAYALQFGNPNNNQEDLYWINSQDEIEPLSPFNLTLVYQLPLKSFPVVTQLSTSAYELFSGNTYTSVGGNDYSGMFFTTPPGTQAITGTYTITGNATIGKQYSTVYVTGFSTFYFKMPTPPANNVQYFYFSIEELLATPAYPQLNGTTFYGLGVQAQLAYFPGAPSYYVVDVFTAAFSASYPSGLINYYNNIQIQGDIFPVTLVYGQIVQSANIPAYQVISPATQTLTLPVTSTQFYQTLVDLGLWTNNTVVYVTGYYYYPTQNEWYQMYGTSYFDAVIIPPSVTMSNVTPYSLVCSNAIWVNFKSPDDVLVTGYYSGTYGMTLPQDLGNIQLANGQELQNVYATLFLPYTELTQANYMFQGGTGVITATNGFFNQGITVNTQPTNVMNGQYVKATGPLQYLISNYPGVSNFTEQSGVSGILNISAVMPNGLAINWSTLMGTVMPPSITYNGPTVTGYEYSATGSTQVMVGDFIVDVPYILPGYNPATNVPTPNFNVTLYVRYQFYQSSQNGFPITPGIYYGPQNALIVITPPNLTVGSKLTLYFVSGDFAVQHYFPKNYWNKTVTITLPNATLTLKAPSIEPLYHLSVPVQIIEPYYAAPYPAQLQIGTNTVTLLANNYNFFGVTPAAGKVGVGKFVSITLTFANGTTEKIYLTGNNVTTLFQGGTLNENGSCTGAYNATISISGLETLLHLTKVSQLNGSVLTITYYDNITHAMATAKIHFGAVSVITPVMTEPALIFYILTAKYVNATAGLPVTLAQSVAVQPYVSLNDTFLAKAMAGVVANLNVTNVTIVDHYGNKYVIYYNSTNGSTDVMVNGKIMYAFKGYLLPTIPETAPNTGLFNGSLVTFVVNMPGMIYKNGTVFNGTLAVMLGTNEATLGPATNFALPAYSFAGKLFGYNSTMYVTVEDAISGSVLTLKTYIAAYNITPIRIAPVTIPVPMPANASTKIEYVYNQPITLTPTSQYIVIHVTSIVNYTYVFYIATLVQQGKNATTVPPVLVNFQTVVPVPVIGPGIVAQVPVQFSQIGALGSGYYTITMFAVPFAGGPVISLYPAKLVFTNVYVNTTVV